MRLQVPLPPTPTPSAVDPTFIFSRITQSVTMVLLMVGFAIVIIKVVGPLARALARRLEGKSGDQQIHADLEQMREQLGEMDSLRDRVGELEERLEFTERLLAQRKDQDLLPRGGNS